MALAANSSRPLAPRRTLVGAELGRRLVTQLQRTDDIITLAFEYVAHRARAACIERFAYLVHRLLASAVPSHAPTTSPPPSPPPSPSARERVAFEGPGRCVSSLGVRGRQQEWRRLLLSDTLHEWLALDGVLEPVPLITGLQERTWVYPEYKHFFPVNTSGLQSLEWAQLKHPAPTGFESIESFASLLQVVGEFMLGVTRIDTRGHQLMAVQASAASSHYTRGWHNDQRAHGRIIVTLTTRGSGLVELQNTQRQGPTLQLEQGPGDYYAMHGAYVLSLDARDDHTTYTPKHMAIASADGRVSFTFRYGFKELCRQ